MVKEEDQHATVNCYKDHLPITTVHIWTQRNMLKEEKIQQNLQELGINLSGSQDKPTLALTIPRSNQVVYKGFPSATQFLSIQALRCGSLPNRNALQHRYDPDAPEDALL